MSRDLQRLPQRAYAATLASVPGVGPRRLRRMLEAAEPAQAWGSLLCGLPEDADGSLMRAAAQVDVAETWRSYGRAGVGVLLRDDPAYPRVLARDPHSPAVLFHLGDPAAVDAQPIVAVVGTRSATRYGLGVAAQLGADLSATGIAVASGLAIGVDGAAHEGAVAGWRAGAGDAAPPIGVVANGLDNPYPRRHARLWERVAEAGVVLSESPIGAGAEKWRFVQRNRLMAAMADVVVVVECHLRGGSLATAAAAVELGVPVGAVPGSIRSPASDGTNALLADGCFPVRDVTDVLVAIGLVRATPLRLKQRAPRAGPPEPGVPASPAEVVASAVEQAAAGPRSSTQREESAQQSVIEALGWEPCPVEHLLRRTGRPLGEVSEALERLASDGKVHGDGGWWSRVASP